MWPARRRPTGRPGPAWRACPPRDRAECSGTPQGTWSASAPALLRAQASRGTARRRDGGPSGPAARGCGTPPRGPGPGRRRTGPVRASGDRRRGRAARAGRGPAGVVRALSRLCLRPRPGPAIAEARPKDRGIGDQRPVRRIEAVEARGDEGGEGLGDRQPRRGTPLGRQTPSSSTRRPWASSIRTVSTAYRGTPSARATMAETAFAGQARAPALPAGALMVGGREGLEVDRGERGASPAPQSGRRSRSSGLASAMIVIGTPRLHSITWSMKSSKPWIGAPEVLEHQDHGSRLRQPLEERPPGGEQLVRADPVSTPSRASRRLDPALLPGSATWVRTVSAIFVRVVASSSPSASPALPRTICPGPEGDPVPIGGERPARHQTWSARPSRYLGTPRPDGSCRSRPGR